MKYAQFNQNTFQMIANPQNLPARWTSPDGATISGFNALPQAALYALGWAPVTFEDLPDAEAYYYSTAASWDTEGKQFVYAAIARDLAVVLAHAETAIDEAASEACGRHLSVGHSQDLRYTEKACEIKAYLAAETPDPTDYPVMVAEAEACGVTLAEKATEIATIRQSWVALCAAIEAARIGGKRACAACTDAETMLSKRDEAITALEAL
nr:hypothetical protein [uncultured Desulfobulbus sp.]